MGSVSCCNTPTTPARVTSLSASVAVRRTTAGPAWARPRPGAEMVMEALKLDETLNSADLVITGEGRLDSQTARFGKGPAAVARHAKNAGIPVIGIAGSLADENELRLLFDGLMPTVLEPCSLEQAIAQARPLLVQAATRAMGLVLIGGRPKPLA